MSQLRQLQVGDIVIMTGRFMGEPECSLAYIYEVYHIGLDRGVSLITENGRDIGGFSPDEQRDYLAYWNHTGFQYEFESVGKLQRDFPKLIKPLFEKVKP